MHYYKTNIGDWVMSTAHLTPEEEGIYLRLINHYYDTEKPINKDETEQVTRRLRLGSYQDMVNSILSEFFILKDNYWIHPRCDSEIKIYKNNAKVRRKNGGKGGRPKKENSKTPEDPKGKGPQDNLEITEQVNLDNLDETKGKPKDNLSVTLTTNHKLLTKNHKPITNNKEIIKEIWAIYPEHRRGGSQQQLSKKIKSMKLKDQDIQDIYNNVLHRNEIDDDFKNQTKFVPGITKFVEEERWKAIINNPVNKNTSGLSDVSKENFETISKWQPPTMRNQHETQ